MDWIGLASLRDSENTMFDYDSVKDRFSGITLPGKLQQWYQKTGYAQTENRTSLVFDKSLHTLLRANQRRQGGAQVCLFVGANIFQGEPKGRATANHWVVLNSPIRIDGKPVGNLFAKGKQANKDAQLHSKKIAFNVYTWGAEIYPLNKRKKHITVAEFLDYFYGYVSAR